MKQAASRRIVITEQAISLFAEGLTIVQSGDHERWEDDRRPGRRREYLDITKQLDWNLLHMPGGPSVFDRQLDGKMPRSMAHLASARDWPLVQSWRKALLEALEARR